MAIKPRLDPVTERELAEAIAIRLCRFTYRPQECVCAKAGKPPCSANMAEAQNVIAVVREGARRG